MTTSISKSDPSMYAIRDKSNGTEICCNSQLTTPKKAWEYFKANHFDALRERPDGTKMSRAEGPNHYSNFYECKLVGTRAPVLRAPGHVLTCQWNEEHGKESMTTGRCTCGWTETCSSKGEVRREFQHHLSQVVPASSKAVAKPQPAEHLPAAERVKKSVQNLKDQGGDRKTFRFTEPTLRKLDMMVTEQNFPNRTAALEAAVRNATLTDAPSGLPFYARHVDDDDVDAVVQEAVHLACRELDSLFPGAAPDGGRGVGSNFQGLLVEHVKAMLTGKNAAQRSHHTELPVLLADDRVFGRWFALPEVQGAGYMVVSTDGQSALSAYSGQFVRLSMQDIDVLFTSHDGAIQAALKHLRGAGTTPQEAQLRIVAGIFDDTRERYVIMGEEDAHDPEKAWKAALRVGASN